MKNLIEKYKICYQLYNFFQRKKLVHNLAKYKQYGLLKRYYSSVCALDFEGIPAQKNKHDLLNSRNELPKQKEFQELDEKTKQEMLSWSENGFVVLKEYFSPAQVEEYNKEVEQMLQNGDVKFENGNKIMFAIHKSKNLFKIGAHKKIVSVLELLLAKKIELFQSINFITGSQQGAHSDSISMTTFPKGNLIAIWVALEDMTMENGPLYYYKGSHKLPYIMNHDFGNEGTKYKLGNKGYDAYLNKIQELLDANGYKKTHFLAKKGDVLIWHANLVHGGEKIVKEGATRKSMVFHYYAKDAIAYHEIKQRPTLKHNFRAFEAD